MKNLSPINENKDVVTKEYVDPVKSQAAINRTTLGTQCKNLLKNNAVTTTINGVTFTVNDDKSITVTGKANDSTKQTIFIFANNSTLKKTIKSGKYILSGCPSGGSSSTYRMFAYHINPSTNIADDGNGVTGDFDYSNTTDSNIAIVIAKGYTDNINLTFYPMLRYADITDSTYEEYQPNLLDRCLLKDTVGIDLGVAQSSSITIDNLSSYTALWINVAGNVSGINFQTNLVVPVSYLAKSTSNSVQLAGGIPSSAYITSEDPLAAKNMDGTITANVSGNTLSLAIGTGTIASIEVVSLI